MKLQRCENCIFFLPVNILTVARWLLGPHDTLPCVLIYSLFCLNLIQIHNWRLLSTDFTVPGGELG